MARDGTSTHKSKLARRLGEFDRFWLTRFMIGVGAWLFVLTVAGFFLEYRNFVADREDRREEREARRLDRISQSWETLLRPVGGNTGKGSALNTLLHENQSLRGADLSCNAVGEWRDETCTRPAILADVEFSWSVTDDGERTNIYDTQALAGVRFAGNRLANLSADTLTLSNAFEDTEGSRWRVGVLYATRPLTEEDDLGAFRCYGCYAEEGAMMWDVYLRFPSSLIRNAWVYIPAGADIGAATALRNQVTLDSLPRFVTVELRDGYRDRLRDFDFIGYWPAEQFHRNLSWDAYRTLEYCANPRDVELLGLPPPRLALDGDNLEPRLRYDMTGTPLENIDYRCGLVFDQVEELVKERLAEWHKAAEQRYRDYRTEAWERVKEKAAERSAE